MIFFVQINFMINYLFNSKLDSIQNFTFLDSIIETYTDEKRIEPTQLMSFDYIK